MRLKSVFAAPSILVLFACGSAGDDTPYTSDPNKTVVIGSGVSAGAQESAACVELPSGECVEAKQCAEGERRDVIVASSGKVMAVVCYPANESPTPVNAEGNVELSKTQNNGVVAIDGADDGVDIAGNVSASGNNVVVYGGGAGVSVIGGNVDTNGNNFSLRGVTVKGNVHVLANNATLVLCAVEGNVVLEGNNNVIADCSVLGNIELKGVNNVLVANEIGGNISVGDDKNTVCDGNVAWTDTNSNKLFEVEERGAAIACGGGGKK